MYCCPMPHPGSISRLDNIGYNRICLMRCTLRYSSVDIYQFTVIRFRFFGESLVGIEYDPIIVHDRYIVH